jgi:hypothetical protein
MTKTWSQCVEEIGWFIDKCFKRNNGQLVCAWCPAHDYCGNDALCGETCSNILTAWAKKETGDA